MLERQKQKIFNIIFSALISRNFIKKGSKVIAGKKTVLTGNYFDGDIKIGEYARVLRSELHGNIIIGKHSALNGPNLDIYAGMGQVSIGNFCSIARNVSIQVENHNYNRITTNQVFKNLFMVDEKNEILSKGGIEIGHDVWIGTHSVILGGVKIGTGVVVAANSVVTRSVPPYAIVAGSPAKIIKYRFEEQVIEQVLQLNWWDWELEKIIKNGLLFSTNLNGSLNFKIKDLVV